MRLEGYGPGDSAVMVDCLTEDRARMKAAVRDAFSRHGGRLGASGSVAYLFNEVGLITYPPGTSRELLADLAWQAGAEDVTVGTGGSLEIETDPLELSAVRSALERAGRAAPASRITYRAHIRVRLSGAQAAAMSQLVSALGQLEGVQGIYTNAEIAG